MTNAINTLKTAGTELVAAERISQGQLDMLLDGITHAEQMEIAYTMVSAFLPPAVRDEIESELPLTIQFEQRTRLAMMEMERLGLVEAFATDELAGVMNDFAQAIDDIVKGH